MNSLSANIYTLIYSFLDYKDIVRASSSCRNAKIGAEKEVVWRELCLRRWIFCRVSKSMNSWKGVFIRRMRTHEGILRGTPQDYAMVACRGHTDYITSVLVVGDYVISG